MQSQRLLLGTLIGLVLGVTTSVSINVFAFKQSAEDAAAIPLEDIRKFTEVYNRVKQDYVEPVKDKEMIGNAIRGMLTGLDPHSDYLNEEEYKELQVGTTGEFGGLGIEVGMEDGFVKVISPIDDTPAQKAGLEAGDLIIRLDDKPVKGMTLNDAVKLMRGKPNTDINLLVVREGKPKPFKVTVTRAVIKVNSVKQRLLESGYGYVRISSFQSKTTDSLSEALTTLQKENKGNLRGLVLDLRNNPGGVLNAAVGVSDAFLESGKIVYTEGRVEDAKMEYSAQKGDLLNGAPIVVLVNRGSASASEIVSGALQDHKRAVIVGQKTFGKGSVQTVLPLDEKTAIKITTARYFTPLGRSIQAEGIKPDIEIKAFKVTPDANATDDADLLSEADLSKHLSNPTLKAAQEADEALKAEDAQKAKPEDKKPEEGKTPTTEDKPQTDDKSSAKPEDQKSQGDAKKDDKPLAEKDYQLFEALNILKGIDLATKRAKEAAASEKAL